MRHRDIILYACLLSAIILLAPSYIGNTCKDVTTTCVKEVNVK